LGGGEEMLRARRPGQTVSSSSSSIAHFLHAVAKKKEHTHTELAV
jgi:hypothetical protein